jgi:hypothetical protein
VGVAPTTPWPGHPILAKGVAPDFHLFFKKKNYFHLFKKKKMNDQTTSFWVE